VNYWKVGDRLHGAGTPVPGEPYVIPTVNEQGQICDMVIKDIEMDGPRHYWGTVASITPAVVKA
jgi:hypothetical protein